MASLPARPSQLPRGDQPTTGRAHDPRPPRTTGHSSAPGRVAVAPRRLAAGRHLPAGAAQAPARHAGRNRGRRGDRGGGRAHALPRPPPPAGPRARLADRRQPAGRGAGHAGQQSLDPAPDLGLHLPARLPPARAGAARAPPPRGPPPEGPPRRGRAAAVADDGRRRAARGGGVGGDLSPDGPRGGGRAGGAAASVGAPCGAPITWPIEDRMMTEDDETEAEAQMEAAAEAIREAVLLQEGEVDPQYIVLAARVAGELGADIARLGGVDLESVLGGLADLVLRAEEYPGGPALSLALEDSVSGTP